MKLPKIAAFIALICGLTLILNSCGVAFLLTYDPEKTTVVEDSKVTVEQYTDPGNGILAAPELTDGEKSTPLMWKVSGGNFDGDFYLLGSIHIGLYDTNYYPDEVYDAYNSCDYLAVESDVIALESDFEAQFASMQFFLYDDGTTIADYIAPELYSRARAVMDHYGMYNEFMDYYTPIMWQQVIEQALTEDTDYLFENGVDRYFLTASKELGKDILEIEDYMDTYAAIAGLSAGTQEFLLAESVEPEYVKTYGETLEILYDLWKVGDLGGLEEYLLADGGDYTDEELEFLEEYNDALMVERNEIMVGRAEEYLADGMEVFYIVGLAHMLGEGGLVDELTDAGYTVELVEYGE